MLTFDLNDIVQLTHWKQNGHQLLSNCILALDMQNVNYAN